MSDTQDGMRAGPRRKERARGVARQAIGAVALCLGLVGAVARPAAATTLSDWTANYVTLTTTNFDPTFDDGFSLYAYVSDSNFLATRQSVTVASNGSFSSGALNTQANFLYWYFESDVVGIPDTNITLDASAAAWFYFPEPGTPTYAQTNDIPTVGGTPGGATGYRMDLFYDFNTSVLAASLVTLYGDPIRVPEPGTAALFLAGLAALGLGRSARFGGRERA